MFTKSFLSLILFINRTKHTTHFVATYNIATYMGSQMFFDVKSKLYFLIESYPMWKLKLSRGSLSIN